MASHGRVRGGDAKSRKNEPEKIVKYNSLVERVNTKLVTEKVYTTETLQLTSELLTANPEYYTIWNHRRRTLLHLFNLDEQHELAVTESSHGSSVHSSQPQAIQLITDDLRFLIPLLKEYPKCYWIWNHRLWLLSQATDKLEVDTSVKIWQEELGLVSKMLSQDARNFHAWDYRRFVVPRLEKLTGKSLVEEEFQYTLKKITGNLSNFSAWHYRSKLIPRLLNERRAQDDDRRKLLDSEFDLVSQALNTDPFDQSLWCYHQFLISTLESTSNEQIVLSLSNHDRLGRLETEIRGIREIEEDTKDCKWLYQSLLKYTALALEIEAGNKIVTTQEMREWMEQLKQLDVLRKGRWYDLEKSLSL